LKRRARISRLIESGLGGAAELSFRRPWLALTIAGVLTVLGVLSARDLRVDANLANMLPRSFESVRNVERLKDRFGGVGYVTVHVSGTEPAVLRRFAAELAQRLETLPTVRYVEYRRPVQFFKDRALYYIDVDDLKEIHQIISKRVKWEKIHANPLYVDLEEIPAPSIDFSHIERKYKRRNKNHWRAETASSESYYLDQPGKQLVILVKPAGISTQIDFARRVVADVLRTVNGLDYSRYPPSLKVQLCGRYTKQVEHQAAINSDLRITSVVALALMLLYLAVHFRRVGAVVLVFVPLLVGLVWTFGVAAVLVDKLNLLSAFFGVILLGLGVDHGIHLLSRVQEEQGQGIGPQERVRMAFGRTGRAVLIAALTTTVAFIGLSVTEFRGFNEFGKIAAAGTALIVLAYLLCLPALIGVASRLRWRLSSGGGEASSWLARGVIKWSPVTFWLGVVCTIAVISQIGQARFEYNFSKLNRRDLPSVRVDRTVDHILGRSQAPLVVLTESDKDSRQVVAALNVRKKKSGSGIDYAVTAADFLPTHQRTKRKIIADILRQLRSVHDVDFKGDTRKQIEQLKRYRDILPFTLADLPAEIRRRFQAPGVAFSPHFVLVYSKVRLSDGVELRRLARELRDIPLGNGRSVSAAGSGMVLADVLDMVFRESPRVMVITVAFVFLAIWILLGGVRRAVLCLLPAGVTLLVTVGLMPLTDTKFNYLNVVMMPVLFGLAVDGGVHMVIRGTSAATLPKVVAETGRAISGAILTTGLGFGALMLAHHPGLQSMARLVLIGLCCNLLATVVLLPAALALPTVLRRGHGATAVDRGRMWWLVDAIATVGAAGYSPVAPAAVAAFIALPAAWSIGLLTTPFRLIVVAAVAALGLLAAWRFLDRASGSEPFKGLVVDVFCGFLVALAWIPFKPGWVLAAGALFLTLHHHQANRWALRMRDGRVRPFWRALALLGSSMTTGLVTGSLLAVLERGTGVWR